MIIFGARVATPRMGRFHAPNYKMAPRTFQGAEVLQRHEENAHSHCSRHEMMRQCLIIDLPIRVPNAVLLHGMRAMPL